MPISNPYLTHINQKISSTLWSLKEDERSNSYNYNNQINLPTPLLDGFFDLYFNTYGYSSVEFINLFKPNERNELPEVMFSQHYSFMGSRKIWFELFTPALNENFHFFQLCFAVCLKHSNLDNISYPTHEAQIVYEQNKNLFMSLIDIGKKQNFFSKIPESDLYTNNVEYQSILVSSQIFENNFSVERLTDFLIESTSIDPRRSTKQLNPFVSTYLADIIKLPETHPDFLEKLEEKKLLNEFLDLFLDIQKPSVNVDNFITFLLKKPIVSSLFIENNNSLLKKLFLTHTPHLLTFFENLSVAGKREIFSNVDLDHSFSSKTYSYSGSFLNKLFALAFDNDNRQNFKYLTKETLEYVFAQLSNYSSNKNKEVDSYIGNLILNYATYSTSSFISQTAPSLEEDTFFNDIKDFFHFVPFVFNIKKNKINDEDYIKMSYFLTNLKERDSQLYDKLSPKIYNNLQDLLYSYFNPVTFSQKHNTYEFNQFLVAFSQFLYKSTSNTIDDALTVLDILNTDLENPAWNKIDKLSYKSESRKNNKTKISYKEGYNFAYYLIEATKGKCLSWFIQPNNLNHFSTIKYKGKGFVSYFHEERWFKEEILKLSQNKEVFQELVLNVKPAIKILETMANSPEHNDIKPILSFYKLDNKIKNKDEEIIPKRAKI